MRSTVYSRMEYLKKIKKENRLVLCIQVLCVIGFLVLWEAAALGGIVDPFIVSSPVRMGRTFVQMSAADLWIHVACTVGETLAGFALGVIIGTAIAMALWFFPVAGRIAAPFLVVLNSLPKVALGPVIIVWAGAGMSAIITMGVAISLIVTIMELCHGFYATDANLMTTVQSFGASKRECFAKVVLPCNIPVLFQSLKVNIGLSLVGVIAGEFLVSKAGLGYLIVYAGQVFRMDLVMMSVVLLGFIAFGMYSCINFAEKAVMKFINHI